MHDNEPQPPAQYETVSSPDRDRGHRPPRRTAGRAQGVTSYAAETQTNELSRRRDAHVITGEANKRCSVGDFSEEAILVVLPIELGSSRDNKDAKKRYKRN